MAEVLNLEGSSRPATGGAGAGSRAGSRPASSAAPPSSAGAPPSSAGGARPAPQAPASNDTLWPGGPPR